MTQEVRDRPLPGSPDQPTPPTIVGLAWPRRLLPPNLERPAAAVRTIAESSPRLASRDRVGEEGGASIVRRLALHRKSNEAQGVSDPHDSFEQRAAMPFMPGAWPRLSERDSELVGSRVPALIAEQNTRARGASFIGRPTRQRVRLLAGPRRLVHRW